MSVCLSVCLSVSVGVCVWVHRDTGIHTPLDWIGWDWLGLAGYHCQIRCQNLSYLIAFLFSRVHPSIHPSIHPCHVWVPLSPPSHSQKRSIYRPHGSSLCLLVASFLSESMAAESLAPAGISESGQRMFRKVAPGWSGKSVTRTPVIVTVIQFGGPPFVHQIV